MAEKLTVLIVEDSPVNRKILAELLLRHGYITRTAETGEAALELLEKELPDLILLDILLPGMDGYATCKQLKTNERTANIPVVFISSLGTTADIIGAFEVGGVDYITKPFQHDEVLARINTHLHIRRLQRKLEEQNRQLAEEKQKSEALLRNVLPERIARELLATGTCVPQLYPDTTVCFIDIVGFTKASSTLAPEIIIRELNDIFTAFDLICGKYGCERMKTIGDAYLFACGIPEENQDHAENVAHSALEMIKFLQQRNSSARHAWQIRVGMHSGPVIGGVIGTEKYLYDIFGDTVNIAARMEKTSCPMQINVSDGTRLLLKDHFLFSNGKETEIKGKGKQITYTLTGYRVNV